MVQQRSMQKYLEIYLDEELLFKHHINEYVNKVKEGITVILKLSNVLPLLTIYDSFLRLHLDYRMVMSYMINQQMIR